MLILEKTTDRPAFFTGQHENTYRFYLSRGTRAKTKQIWRCASFQKIKVQFFVGAADSDNESAHEEDLDEPTSPGH